MKYNKKRWKMNISIVLGTGTIKLFKPCLKAFLIPESKKDERKDEKSA